VWAAAHPLVQPASLLCCATRTND